MKKTGLLEIPELRDWLVPLLISLYFVPMPVLSVKLLPFILVALLLTDSRLRINVAEVATHCFFVACGFLILTIQPEKFLPLVSFMLAFLVSRLLWLIPRDWSFVPTLSLNVGAALASLLTLHFTGNDFISSTIYGESRHGIHVNSFLDFRISGLYQEPSTMAIQMLLMSVWASNAHPKKNWVPLGFSILAMASFSSVTIIAMLKIAMDQKRVLLSNAGLKAAALAALVGYWFLPTFYYFFMDKVQVYSALDIDSIRRLELIFVTSNLIKIGEFDFLLGHTVELLQNYVVYDLGIILATPMIFGLLGLLMLIVFLKGMRWNLINVILVIATKAAIINPLLWVATRKTSKNLQ